MCCASRATLLAAIRITDLTDLHWDAVEDNPMVDQQVPPCQLNTLVLKATVCAVER
jgi:hypothetical protein